MPYVLKHEGSKWCVYNKDTGASKGCSDSEEKGKAHLRALYANEKKQLEVDMELLDFEDVVTTEKAVDAEHTHEHIHQHYHEHSHDGGDTHSHYHGHQHEHSHDHSTYDHAHFHTMHEGDMDAHEHNTTQAHVHSDSVYNAKAFVPPVIKPKGLMDKLKSIVGLNREPAITLFKEESGRTRVMMRGSNMFKDRHKEIITQEAHKGFADYVTSNPDEMPEFWVWHIPGSRWGQADVVDFSDGFLTVSGLVDEGYEDVAKSLARPDWGVSHGFNGITLSGKGFIDAYKSFEFSPLPRDQAANLFTAMILAKELGVDKGKRQKLLDVGISEELLTKWESESKDIGDALKELGIQYKEDEQTPTVETPPATTEDTTAKEPTLADVLGAITKVANRLDVVEKKQKEYEESDENKVASVLEAAINPGQTKGHVASQSKENAPSTEQVQQDDSWLNELLLKGV